MYTYLWVETKGPRGKVDPAKGDAEGGHGLRAVTMDLDARPGADDVSDRRAPLVKHYHQCPFGRLGDLLPVLARWVRD